MVSAGLFWGASSGVFSFSATCWGVVVSALPSFLFSTIDATETRITANTIRQAEIASIRLFLFILFITTSP